MKKALNNFLYMETLGKCDNIYQQSRFQISKKIQERLDIVFEYNVLIGNIHITNMAIIRAIKESLINE